METLNLLPGLTTKNKKRVGRGVGSKKGGHTTGRGQKGDKARGGTKATFIGTKIKKGFIKRLPFMRGKHHMHPRHTNDVVNLTYLETHYKDGDVVTLSFTKILSGGVLTKKLTIKNTPTSASAKSKIIAQGGKIE